MKPVSNQDSIQSATLRIFVRRGNRWSPVCPDHTVFFCGWTFWPPECDRESASGDSEENNYFAVFWGPGSKKGHRVGSFFQKIETAFSLGGVCWKVLMLDKEMLLFPVFSTLALFGLLGGIFWPLWSSGELQLFVESFQSEADFQNDPRVLIGGFLIYFACSFIVIFFNAALLTCAMIRFAGGDPTVMDGLRSSCRNLHQIFVWSLFASTVGYALQLIESRLSGLARFFVGALGVAWAIAIYFAIPVLVVERVGPIEAVKRSVAALRKTWGEALVSHIGLSGLSMLAAIIGFLLIFAGGIRVNDQPYVAFTFWATAGVWFIATTLIITTLTSILKAALYIYAVEGEMPAYFDERTIRSAFGKKDD
jgi:hypothetical protein